jgi:hypothetical protein
VKEKTKLHQTYLNQTVTVGSSIEITDPTVPNPEKLPNKQTYTSIRFWNDQNVCIGNFYLEDVAILFQDKFLLVGES